MLVNKCTLSGAYFKKSKKGTDCLFVSILAPYSEDEIKDGAKGMKVINAVAFGNEALQLTKSAYDHVGKTVDVLGTYQNNSFFIIAIQ